MEELFLVALVVAVAVGIVKELMEGSKRLSKKRSWMNAG